MYFYCEKCKKKYPISTMSYKCEECGGLFRLNRQQGEEVAHGISIGHMHTDILPLKVNGIEFLLKTENLLPTGSFKDRGAYTLINEIRKVGIKKITIDSSGNAGAAVAAYAAAAGMDCTVYVPRGTSPDKLRQIRAYGAHIIEAEGGRTGACEAVKANLGNAYYASHVYNPLFIDGMKQIAFEIYEQLGHHVPEYIFLPVGNGTMLLGLYYGFMEIGHLPRLVPVQSKHCAPLYEAFNNLKPSTHTDTIAEAIRVEAPKRMQEMLEAVKNSGGDVLIVEDEQIAEAKKLLGHHGIYVETTSAAALAGATMIFGSAKPDNYRVVIPLTGNGLKG